MGTDEHTETLNAIVAGNRDVPDSPFTATQDCSTIIHIAFFFDGTGNNREADAPLKQWSNVATLFDSFDLAPTEGVYGYYISGVGTKFNGTAPPWEASTVWSEDHLLGGMAGAGGDRRLAMGDDTLGSALQQTLKIKEEQFSKEVKQHSIENQGKAVREIKGAVQNHRLVRSINISIFGFSRGAALSRAFANRIIENCKDKAGNLTYKGYPLRLNLVGIFDTVASFGVPSENISLPFDKRDLRISPHVEKCYHLVAGNELRFSFPVTLIRENGAYNGGMTELVLPGVHSDVGGGYQPIEQGISNHLARLPLNMMYDQAMQCGIKFVSKRRMADDRPLVLDRYEIQADLQNLYGSYMTRFGAQSGTVESRIEKHMSAFYSSCGTASRAGTALVGDASLKNSWMKRSFAEDIVNEEPAYEDAFKKKESLLYRSGRIYYYYFKTEQWPINAWHTQAQAPELNMVTHYVHNSKVDFVFNVEPFSYFRPRGVLEPT